MTAIKYSILFCLMGSVSFLQAQSKDMDIRKLVDLLKVEESVELMLDQSIVVLKQQYPKIPVSYWSELKRKIDYSQFTEMVIPVYNKTFSHQEVKDLIQFFSTPVGRKYVRELPAINTAIYNVSHEYGRALSQQIVQQMRTDGFRI